MSHSNTPKQSNLFLWLIIPIAAALTLLMTRHNHKIAKTADSRVEIEGALPMQEEVKTAPVAAHSEGTVEMTTDTTHHESAAPEAVHAPAH